MCHGLEETDSSYFVSLYPGLTYADAVMCYDCVVRLADMIDSGRIPRPEFEDWVIEVSTKRKDADGGYGLPDIGFFWSGYDEIIDFYCYRSSPAPDERECNECGGLMITEFFEGDDDEASKYQDDGLVMIYLCLNCGRWVYVD